MKKGLTPKRRLASKPKHKNGRGIVEQVSNARLIALAVTHGHKRVAEFFHMHPSSVANWMKGEKMPAYAGTLCEALERRFAEATAATKAPCTIIIQMSSMDSLVVAMLTRLGVKFLVVDLI